MKIPERYLLIAFSYHALCGQGFATDVLTYHNDNARTGWNSNEVVLTPGNVNESTFGLKYNLVVDGKVDAQPLYVSNAVVFSGGSQEGNHNLVIVATEHDSLYAFDADSGAPYWKTTLLVSGETPSDDRGCDQVTPEIGVTSTPVIDRNEGVNGTIYVVAMSKSGTVYYQRLHAISLATGLEVPGSPVVIQASFPGSGPHNDGRGNVTFDPGAYKERSGLLLLNGVVYTTWASHCDIPPYTSWIIGYDETTLAQVEVLNLDPNGTAASTLLPDGSGNAFWNSGAGPAADSSGNIYDLTANGPFETTLVNGFPSGGDYGDSFVKLSTSGPLRVVDYFTPFDQAFAAQQDIDLGSGGTLVLPDMVDANGLTRHLTIGAGKDSNIYLVDRDAMGKFRPGATSNSYVYQELANALPRGEWATAAYFNGAVYYGPVNGALRRFTFSQARLNPTPSATTSALFGYPGVTPSISSSGTRNGIVWAYENAASGAAVLHAYDATTLVELYSSVQNSVRDGFGTANKFITPTVCNGEVFVGTTNSVGVFGLLQGGQVSSPKVLVTIPNPPDFNGDGKQDFLWRNTSTGQVGIWLMNGPNATAVGNLGSPPLSWVIINTGDFDGSGRSDILWQFASSEQYGVWFMNGTQVTAVQNFTLPAYASQICCVADFDGDGLDDLVTFDRSGGVIYFWKNTGSLQFVYQTSYRVAAASGWLPVGTASLNSPSAPPAVIWRNAITGEIAAWFMSAFTWSSVASFGNPGADVVLSGFGDFSEDGRADLLLFNIASKLVGYWQSNGAQQPSFVPLAEVSSSWVPVSAEYLYGGGNADIIWRQTSSGALGVWQVSGSTWSVGIGSALVGSTWQLQPLGFAP
jgi:FG-GAP-like repeat